MTLTKEKIYALISAVVAAIVLFLLLWFIYMPQINNDDVLDEGVMVSFGDAADGGGNDMTVKDVYSPPIESQSPKTAKSLPSEEELMTQKTASVAKVTEKTKQTKQKTSEVDLKAQAEQRRVAEQRRSEQNAISKANDEMAGLFGNTGGKGSGTTSGDSRQNNPVGGNGSRGKFLSDGRRMINDLKPSPPPKNIPGKITIEVRVDASGKVLSAKLSTPTNISDADYIRSSIETAKKSIYQPGGSGVAIGKITYDFTN